MRGFVGETNAYIRALFLVGGAIHGLIATVVTMLLFLPLAVWLGPKAERFFGGPNLYDYYLANFLRHGRRTNRFIGSNPERRDEG